MSITFALQLGLPTAVVQTNAYALPERRCILSMTDTTQVITMSNVVDMSNPVVLSFTNGQVEVNGGFIACTTGTPTVLVKAF